jgi:hypothetical protein
MIQTSKITTNSCLNLNRELLVLWLKRTKFNSINLKKFAFQKPLLEVIKQFSIKFQHVQSY